MMIDPWQTVVQRHVETWTAKCASRGSKWLPRFAYHFTNIPNAVSILRTGALLSRTEALRRRLMQTDNACPSIISGTQPLHRSYVRLYFRPLTPTQFRNEGIRPPGSIWNGAHCPVPVFFLFELSKVLLRSGVEVSDGNMGSPSAQHARSLNLFNSIPFDLVYHEGGVGWTKKVNYHRQAEILVPTQLDLHDLVALACRSEAERQTLLHLLPDARWAKRVFVAPELFFKSWFYVETAHSEGDQFVVRYNRAGDPPFGPPRPIQVDVRVVERDTGRYWHEQSIQTAREHRRALLGTPARCLMTVTVEGCLAYENMLAFTDDIPF